jgi:signal transduction histidine kinase
VRDTFIGIPQSNLKRIFDPFFTTKSEGTGLGLSISAKILEGHGATIDVVSEEGKGSTFNIFFPGGRM